MSPSTWRWRNFLLPLALLLLGCQSPSGGWSASSDEAMERKAKNDPFPTASAAGLTPDQQRD